LILKPGDAQKQELITGRRRVLRELGCKRPTPFWWSVGPGSAAHHEKLAALRSGGRAPERFARNAFRFPAIQPTHSLVYHPALLVNQAPTEAVSAFGLGFCCVGVELAIAVTVELPRMRPAAFVLVVAPYGRGVFGPRARIARGRPVEFFFGGGDKKMKGVIQGRTAPPETVFLADPFGLKPCKTGAHTPARAWRDPDRPSECADATGTYFCVTARGPCDRPVQMCQAFAPPARQRCFTAARSTGLRRGGERYAGSDMVRPTAARCARTCHVDQGRGHSRPGLSRP